MGRSRLAWDRLAYVQHLERFGSPGFDDLMMPSAGLG